MSPIFSCARLLLLRFTWRSELGELNDCSLRVPLVHFPSDPGPMFLHASLLRLLIFFSLGNVSTFLTAFAHVHSLVFVARPLITLVLYTPSSPVLFIDLYTYLVGRFTRSLGSILYGVNLEKSFCPAGSTTPGTGPRKRGLERTRTSERGSGMARLIVTAKSNEMYGKRRGSFHVSDRVPNNTDTAERNPTGLTMRSR